MKVVERDFTKKGTMRMITKEQRDQLKGFLPFYSVDTREEADALIEAALDAGEFVRRPDGRIFETTLIYEQTLENLYLAGDRLAEIHQKLREDDGTGS